MESKAKLFDEVSELFILNKRSEELKWVNGNSSN